MERMRDVMKAGLWRGLSSLPQQDRLAMAWLVVCGRPLAGRGSVVGFSDGVVKIEVRDPAWLEEMRSMSGHLESELARVAGMKITKLHFIVNR
jgi:Dna[CI] antecedent, DciA